MARKSKYVDQLSIVLVRPDNPANLFNSDYLRQHEIISEDEKVDTKLSVPIVTQLVFPGDKIEFEANPDSSQFRVTFLKEPPEQILAHFVGRLAHMASQFVKATATMPYTGIGINVRHVVRRDSMKPLLSALGTKYTPMSLSFSESRGRFRSTYTLQDGRLKANNAQVVIVLSNHHVDVQADMPFVQRRSFLQGLIESYQQQIAHSEEVIDELAF